MAKKTAKKKSANRAIAQTATTPTIPTPEQPVTRAITTRYRNTQYFNYIRDLPPFTFETIRAMLQDPEIRLALAMRAAPIQSVEFAYIDGIDADGKPKWVPGIKARNPVVAAWVLRQIQTIWYSYLPGLLRSQVWGWASGEVTLRLSDSGLIEIDQLLSRHAKDCRLLEYPSTGDSWGVRITNVVGATQAVDLPYPYCYFVNFRPEDGEKYSKSILLGAYSPWADQWLNGGALDTRRLYMHKDAYGGMKIFYPEEDVFVDDNRSIPARDIALQIAEQKASGGTLTAPSTTDTQGNPKWRIEEATVSSNPAHILQYPKDLDTEKRHGLEIPDGAISNDGSGAWEGKSLPMAAFYAGLDTWVTQMIVDLRRTLDPLIEMNFGCNEEYEIRHKPMALTMLQQQGEKKSGDGMEMQDAEQQMQSNAYRMGINPMEAVGEGVLSAASIVKAARMALSNDDGSRWITIGGDNGPNGKDGGFHVKIDKDGKIISGKFAGMSMQEAFGNGRKKQSAQSKPNRTGNTQFSSSDWIGKDKLLDYLNEQLMKSDPGYRAMDAAKKLAHLMPMIEKKGLDPSKVLKQVGLSADVLKAYPELEKFLQNR